MARFHPKYHKRNHHTLSSVGYPDSASDPIASPSDPFQGDMHIAGELSATDLKVTNPVSSFEVDGITGTIASMTVTGGLSSDGGTINADQLGGTAASGFVTQAEVGAVNGVAALDASGYVPLSSMNPNIDAGFLGGVAAANYLKTSDIGVSVEAINKAVTINTLSSYDIQSTDRFILANNLLSSVMFLNLPDTSSVGDGFILTLKKIDDNGDVQITPFAVNQPVDSLSSGATLTTQYESINLVSESLSWFIY